MVEEEHFFFSLNSHDTAWRLNGNTSFLLGREENQVLITQHQAMGAVAVIITIETITYYNKQINISLWFAAVLQSVLLKKFNQHLNSTVV